MQARAMRDWHPRINERNGTVAYAPYSARSHLLETFDVVETLPLKATVAL